jgi:nucleoid-associated protein YgaU
MHKDFKIGLVVGLVLLIIAMGWIAGHESLSTESRLAREQASAAPPEETPPEQTPAEETRPVEAPPAPPAEPNDSRPITARDLLPIEKDTKIETTPIFSPPVADASLKSDTEPVAPSTPTPVYHEVGEGESLSTIAKIHYGSSAQWKRILRANTGVIQDAHKIRPGMRLLIPPLED